MAHSRKAGHTPKSLVTPSFSVSWHRAFVRKQRSLITSTTTMGATISLFGIEADSYTKRGLRRALAMLAKEKGRTIRVVLLMRPACGNVISHEILAWLGIEGPQEPHDCVCRTCGRRMTTPVKTKPAD